MLVFNKEKCVKFIESLGQNPEVHYCWIDDCVGRIIDKSTMQSHGCYRISCYNIMPEWCDEVNITDFLTPAEIECIMQEGYSFEDINTLTTDIDSFIDFLTPMYGRGTPECAEMTRRIENGVFSHS